jgi:anti-sigma factor RsiW
VEETARARVETHLRGCRSCLDGYLSLKRSIEAADLEPSDEAHVRLRDAVERELSAAEPAAWLWRERPLVVAFATPRSCWPPSWSVNSEASCTCGLQFWGKRGDQDRRLADDCVDQQARVHGFSQS